MILLSFVIFSINFYFKNKYNFSRGLKLNKLIGEDVEIIESSIVNDDIDFKNIQKKLKFRLNNYDN
jgi:hypothetical protein